MIHARMVFFLDVESLLTFKAKEKERDNKNEKER